MSKPNQAYAYFSLSAFDEEPEAITEMIGLTPTDTWKKGDVHPTARYERRFSRWTLRSRLPDSEALEDHVNDVLTQLESALARVAGLSKKYGGMIQLVGYFHTYYPGFGLSHEALAKIASLGACLDCDFYYLY